MWFKTQKLKRLLLLFLPCIFVLILIVRFTSLFNQTQLEMPSFPPSFDTTTAQQVPSQPVVTETPKPKHQPLFIIKTYYYKNSKSFNGSDAFVVLFNAERYDYNSKVFQCKRTLANGKIETRSGKLIDLEVSPPVCKLAIFRLTCLFPPINEKITAFFVGVKTETATTKYGELIFNQPQKKKYGFVSCMSRMVAGDDWAMIIFAMEVFRLFGGDLAVAPVECVITQVMDLLRLYEKDGILKVQPGFKPRALVTMNYDPNFETEYANQVANSHECFYDFKESAEFIAFPDWDDILIGTYQQGRFVSYYESFSPFKQTHPNAVAFAVHRINAYLKKPLHPTDKKFSIAKKLNETYFNPTYTDSKMVIRPQFVAGNWIHESKVKESPEYNQIKVNSLVATMAHLHNTLSSKSTIAQIPPVAATQINSYDYIDSEALDSNFIAMTKRHSFDFNHKKYPYFRLFHRLLTRCYRGILDDLFNTNITYCPTPKICTFPKQNVKAYKIKSKYSKPIVTEPFTWHERQETKFVVTKNGCL